MSDSKFTALYWRARAEEARAIAEQLTDPEALRAMMGIAIAYDKLAIKAEARAAGIPTLRGKS